MSFNILVKAILLDCIFYVSFNSPLNHCYWQETMLICERKIEWMFKLVRWPLHLQDCSCFRIFRGFGNRSTMCFSNFLSFSIFFSNFPWFFEKFKGKTYWWIHYQQKIEISRKKWKKVNHTSNLLENDWNITDFCQ